MSDLINSDDVTGTDVYGTDGGKVGHIDHLMIDKQSGHITYAVMHFGGFLGMGEEAHPIPWDRLTYDTSKNGYVTGITQEQLTGSPARRDGWDRDAAFRDETYAYYQSRPYWV